MQEDNQFTRQLKDIIYWDIDRNYSTKFFEITFTRSSLTSDFNNAAVRDPKFQADQDAVTKFKSGLQSIIDVFDDSVKKISFFFQ